MTKQFLVQLSSLTFWNKIKFDKKKKKKEKNFQKAVSDRNRNFKIEV